MNGIIDLHVHTNYSDGFDTIEEVISKAKNNGVKVMSLTEHYNLSSYKEAVKLAKEDIEIIEGIEIGTDMSFLEGKHVCHILGYFVSPDIYELLDKYEMDRYECTIKTISLLQKQDIKINIEDVVKYARSKKSIGRYDIAIALYELGYANSPNEAYGKYLDHKGKNYVNRKKLTPFELVDAIAFYGGVPVLAHPKSLRMSEKEEEVFICELAKAGLKGIEVYNPNNSQAARQKYLTLCEKYNLIPTVGSDYHGGKRKPVIEIGRGINDNLNIQDYEIVKALKKAHKEIIYNENKKQI